jgi:hypothetical protein
MVRRVVPWEECKNRGADMGRCDPVDYALLRALQIEILTRLALSLRATALNGLELPLTAWLRGRCTRCLASSDVYPS